MVLIRDGRRVAITLTLCSALALRWNETWTWWGDFFSQPSSIFDMRKPQTLYLVVVVVGVCVCQPLSKGLVRVYRDFLIILILLPLSSQSRPRAFHRPILDLEFVTKDCQSRLLWELKVNSCAMMNYWKIIHFGETNVDKNQPTTTKAVGEVDN